MSTLPTTPPFQTVDLKSNHRTLVARTHSGRRSARQVDGHFWSFTAVYPRLPRDEFMPVFAFTAKMKGRFQTFDVIPPDLATPRGAASGTPVVDGASQTGDQLATRGWDASVTGIMKAGDILRMAGHTKVYMVVEDADSDGSGNATLRIEPELVESPADGESIQVANVPLRVAMSSDTREYAVRPPVIYTYEFDCEEVVE
jgi:hypothetical protein